MYYRAYTCTYRRLILIQISRRSYRAYTYMEVPTSTTELTLEKEVPIGTIELILV